MLATKKAIRKNLKEKDLGKVGQRSKEICGPKVFFKPNLERLKIFLGPMDDFSGWTDHPTKMLSKNQVMYYFEIVAVRDLVQAIIHVYFTVDKNGY